MLTTAEQRQLIKIYCTERLCTGCILEKISRPDVTCADDSLDDSEIEENFRVMWRGLMDEEDRCVEPEVNQIRYICDRRACEVCDPNCRVTKDIRHAKNFELKGRAMVEVDRDATSAHTV